MQPRGARGVRPRPPVRPASERHPRPRPANAPRGGVVWLMRPLLLPPRMDPVRQVGEALDAIEPCRVEDSANYSTAAVAETSIPAAPPARSRGHAGREPTPRSCSRDRPRRSTASRSTASDELPALPARSGERLAQPAGGRRWRGDPVAPVWTTWRSPAAAVAKCSICPSAISAWTPSTFAIRRPTPARCRSARPRGRTSPRCPARVPDAFLFPRYAEGRGAYSLTSSWRTVCDDAKLGITAMQANHPHLTTQKSSYVEISRARDRIELVTDDAQALREQLEVVTGERISALEGIGKGVRVRERSRESETGRAASPEAERIGERGRDMEPGGGPMLLGSLARERRKGGWDYDGRVACHGMRIRPGPPVPEHARRTSTVVESWTGVEGYGQLAGGAGSCKAWKDDTAIGSELRMPRSRESAATPGNRVRG